MSTVNPARPSSLFLEDANLIEAAVEATAQVGDDMRDDPIATSDTEAMKMIARRFLANSAPSLLEVLDKHPDINSTADRLIKIGRNISATMRYARLTAPDKGATGESLYAHYKDKIAGALQLLSEECKSLAEILKGEAPKVPKVRFGQTELEMPVVTLGCMRFQQSWNRGKPEDKVLDMSKVDDGCQKNLVEILRYAYQCGVNHIETAKSYGSSELQLGFALKELFESGEMKREDLIIQTKLPVTAANSIEEFKDAILKSIACLQLDYVDLFSVHGLNLQSHFDLLFNNPDGNMIEACNQLKKEGKIRHIGFSTHAPAKLIRKAVETDAFEYVNLHYQFCGSYTCTGDLEFAGNLSNVRLCHEKDMGVFIISIYDKGGRLYAPSNKLRDLCLPDMEPMTYGSVWMWQHSMFDEKKAPLHTFTVGAARPSDLDQPVLDAIQLLKDQDELAARRQRVTDRLSKAMEDALGKKWMETWHVGLPNAYESRFQTHLTGLVWTYNLVQAWGMLDFAKDRYGPMENN
eukprot:scaffold4226_cov174-Cylindrotheca_fusiformis.AAC.1